MKDNKKTWDGMLSIKENGQVVYKKENCTQIKEFILNEIIQKNKIQYNTKGGSGL